jgi:hypothetical protein
MNLPTNHALTAFLAVCLPLAGCATAPPAEVLLDAEPTATGSLFQQK